MPRKQIETYVLDTCTIVHDPKSLTAFPNSKIIIPITVLEELDGVKAKASASGKNARIAIKKIYEYCSQGGNLKKGIKITDNIILSLDANNYKDDKFNCGNNDDKILACAFANKSIIVSRDVNLLVRALSAGLTTKFYENDNNNEIEGYTGMIEVKEDIECEFGVDGLESVIGTQFETLNPNEFVQIDIGGKTAIYRRHFDNSLRPLRIPSNVYGIKSKNKQQAAALDLLLDQNVKLVSITGTAGSGKTLLTLAAAINQTIEQKIYNCIQYYRPTVGIGNSKFDVGFLPGGLDEKLERWAAPLYDNLEVLVKKDVDSFMFMYKEKIKIESLHFLKGRTVQAFIVVDEAQELSQSDIKAIITRCGSGAKIVLIGDQAQIESNYIDESNNGLASIVEKFKPYSIAGHITLEKSERSTLAAIAASIL